MVVTAGRFITLEGGEGAGKSTQVRRVAEWLAGEGVATRVTREPGGSPDAEALRAMLLEGRVAPFGPEAEALVFALARADHVRRTIRPALQDGEWVVCDRFFDSTRAYQGAAGVGPEVLDRLDAIAVGETRPDLTLILDLAPTRGMERVRARGGAADRFEGDALAVQAARREAFLAIAAAEPGRCVVIDAERDADMVFADIRAVVAERLSPASVGTRAAASG